MNLLMITRKVDRNEHLAGFIYNWVKKLGGQVEELRVISWQEGDSSGLPDNIKIFHLRTDQNKLYKVLNFWRLININIKDVDGVFCHQMPIYTILAAPIAKLYRKKIVCWYAHGAVNFQVRLMDFLANIVLTSSTKGYRLNSKKMTVIGQGIDTDKFVPPAGRVKSNLLNLITIGRISPSKDYESIIKAIDILVAKGISDIKLKIIGAPGLAGQNVYLENLKLMVVKMNLGSKIEFLGAIPNHEIVKYLQQADIFINMSNTGSLDKAVLEAMACGCLVITSNEAFVNLLPAIFMARSNQPGELADKIEAIINFSDAEKDYYRQSSRQEVKNNHNLDDLIKKICSKFQDKRKTII
jgi:glycosyltransferase involved in cell wall biosynthesis